MRSGGDLLARQYISWMWTLIATVSGRQRIPSGIGDVVQGAANLAAL
jgi:hypothetical protein